jgi:hypothetical protein
MKSRGNPRCFYFLFSFYILAVGDMRLHYILQDCSKRRGRDNTLGHSPRVHINPRVTFVGKYSADAKLCTWSVVSPKYFPHKGDSRVYIKLSRNDVKNCLSLHSSSNHAKYNEVLCPQLHHAVGKHKISCK